MDIVAKTTPIDLTPSQKAEVKAQQLIGLARASYQRNPRLALASAEKAYELQPGRLDTVETLGWLLLPTDPSRGKKLLGAAIEATDGYDNDPQVLLQRARIFSLLGEDEAAMDCLTEALRESPRFHEDVERAAPLFFAKLSKLAAFLELLSDAKSRFQQAQEARGEADRIAKLIPSPQDNPRKAEAWAKKQLKGGQVKFAEILPEKFDFYLGGCIEQRFFLSGAREQKAYEQLLRHLNVSEQERKRLKNLDGLFRVHELKLKKNAAGDVVEIRGLGGDIWPFDLLEPLADLIKPDSFFLILDDASKFWKVGFEDGKVTYFRGTWTLPAAPQGSRKK